MKTNQSNENMLNGLIQEWRIQHRALGASAYKVIGKKGSGDGLVSYNFGKRVHNAKEKIFTAFDIENIMELIKQKNDEGFNIMLHPVDNDYYFLVVNAIKKNSVLKFQQEFSPCLITKYALNNMQGVLKVLKEDNEESSDSALSVVQTVNNIYGKEGFGNCSTPIPMVGMVNHLNAGFMITTIDSDPVRSTRAESMISQKQKASQKLEIKKPFELTVEEARLALQEAAKSNVSSIRKSLDTHKNPSIEKLKEILNNADGKNVASFLKGVEDKGVKVRANLIKGGMSGFSYTIEGQKLTSRELGEEYSWNNLSKKLGYKKSDYRHLKDRCVSTKEPAPEPRKARP